MDLSKIRKPVLVLDEEKCRRNIEFMARKAGNASVTLRPHFKTHQSLAVGEWFRDENIDRITVSSVTMAKHFVQNGWKDITIAFPFNIRELKDLKSLSETCRVNILSPNTEHLEILVNKTDFETSCFIKINTGNNRSGLEWNDTDEILRMADMLDKCRHIRLAGFLVHDGHTYKTNSIREIIEIHNDTAIKIRYLREITNGRELIISTGDTPSCSLASDFTGIDEIRPGNFVFYDLTQAQLGSCKKENIAVALACPVVEKNLARGEIIIYGGGVHLSKESLRLPDGRIVFGEVVDLNASGWTFPEEESFVSSISQEHGIISPGKKLFNSVKIGDLVGVIPVHSCMTADLMKGYLLTSNRYISDFSPG